MHKMKAAKNMRKPPPLATAAAPSATDNFEIELYWCVQELESAYNSGKLSQKIAEETAKNIKILKGNTAPLVKKRQVMKAALGDYRAKMRDEEKKMALVSKQIKFTSQTTTNPSKSSFVKKSAILSSGKDFRFNFEPPMDNGITKIETESISQNITPTNKPITFTSGADFRFNFAVDEVNEDLNLNELSLNS